MPTIDVVLRNWIVETTSRESSDFADVVSTDYSPEEVLPAGISGRGCRIRHHVRVAVELLGADEREIIERYHYMGQSLVAIARATERPAPIVQSVYNQALNKLYQALSSFVIEEFGFHPHPPLPVIEFRTGIHGAGATMSPSARKSLAKAARSCLICRSPYRQAIDSLIASRNKQETWKPVLREIRERFGIDTRVPQRLISHERYH